MVAVAPTLGEQLQTLHTLHQNGGLTAGEFSLAKTHLLQQTTGAVAAPPTAADAPLAVPDAPAPAEAATTTTRAAASSTSQLVPLLAAAVRTPRMVTIPDPSAVAEPHDAPPIVPPSAAALDEMVDGLRAALAGEELARRGALASLMADIDAVCASLSASGDERLCTSVIDAVGSALKQKRVGRSSKRLAASLLTAFAAADGTPTHRPAFPGSVCQLRLTRRRAAAGSLAPAAWSWLFATDAADPGLALLCEALRDDEVFVHLAKVVGEGEGRWAELFQAAASSLPPQRWLCILLRLALVCGNSAADSTTLQEKLGGATELAEALAAVALPHASKSREGTAAGEPFDAQFGDVGSQAARLLALRLLATPLVSAHLTSATMSAALGALKDAAADGASSVRVGVLGECHTPPRQTQQTPDHIWERFPLTVGCVGM